MARTLAFSIATLVAAMISVQLGASFGKHLFPLVGPAGATALRLFFASLILFAIFRPWQSSYKKKQVLIIVAYGICLGAMNLLFYLALTRMALGIAVALELTGPLSLALLFSRRRLDIVWVLLAILGVALIVPSSIGAGGVPLDGILLALAAGALWAGYIYFGQKAGRSSDGGKVVALGMAIAAIVVLPVAIVLSNSSIVDVNVWPYAILIAVLSSALPFSLEMISLKTMPTTTFGVFMSLEPVVAAIVGFIFLQESLLWTQCLAIGLIVLASAGIAKQRP